MLFKKSEPKKRHPILAVMIGGLSVIGAGCLLSACKQCCVDHLHGIVRMFKKDKKIVEDCIGELAE